jgi:hypothetical protein
MEDTTQNDFVEIPPYNYYWSKNKRGEIHNELFDLVRIKRSTIYPEFQKRQRAPAQVSSTLESFVLLNWARPRKCFNRKSSPFNTRSPG